MPRLPILCLTLALAASLPAPGSSQAPDEASRRGVRAVRAPERPDIDGVLDEAFWAGIEPITDFKQWEPVEGGEPTEGTEVRIAYDEHALYFGMLLRDSDPGAIRRSILQREGRIDQDDRFIICLDTYHDGRNAYVFELNAFGTQGDALISDESMTHDDWNWEGVYESEARITDEGWVLEVAIPFTTIRFSDAAEPTMGVAFYRHIRRKNEELTWPHIPQRFRSGIFQVSQYGTLTGLSGLRRGRYAEVKPFAIAGAQKLGGQADTDILDDVGVDAKVSLTSNLTMDLTWNTDFAQVEADNVQVNLTQYSLFFPEKREFFLERAGLFSFGAAQETELFFSRTVGLVNPIRGGGRLTGEVGPLSVGALALRTDDVEVGGERRPGAWSSVARVRANVLARTAVGGIVTSLDREGSHNRAAGVDAEARFWGSSSLLLWAANVWDSERAGDAGSSAAGQAELVLRNDLWFFELTRTVIGEAFEPALGFVPRPDQKRWGGQLGMIPRFESSTWARQLSVFLQGNHIEGMDGDKQSHFRRVQGRLAFQTGDFANVEVSERFERRVVPATIQGRQLPAGDYTFRFLSGGLRTNESRTLSGNLGGSLGDFWSGTLGSVNAGVTWKSGPNLTLGGSASRNEVSLPVPGGDFTTRVLSLNVLAAISRKLFANALLQWDDVSRTFQGNVRIDWIHTPGSDLFLVLDTGYFTGDLLDPRDTRWKQRTGIVKVTYLKAF
ncbi:MAG: DUF5916 domain-containing protein [Longimicrobiales bacterium]|nr:DUF5916 domain-containing protein [Longimicrobiales bacterium]